MDTEVTQEMVDAPEVETYPYEYTPEELAMFPRVEGQEVEVEEEASPEFEEAPSDEDDPWAWAKEHDPAKVRKTWEKFTEEWQKVAELEGQYKPYMELANEIQTNPALQAHLRAFYEQGNQLPNEVENLRAQMAQLQRDMSVKEELGELKKYVTSEGLPEVEDREVMEYAAKHNSPDLRSAYRDLTYDLVRQQAEEKVINQVKKAKGASVPKVGKADVGAATTLTQRMIDKMDDDEFARRYPEIQEFYAKNG